MLLQSPTSSQPSVQHKPPSPKSTSSKSANQGRSQLARPASLDVATTVSQLPKDPSTRAAHCPRLARIPSTDVAPTVSLQPLDVRTPDAHRPIARSHCSAVVPTKSRQPRATTTRAARNRARRLSLAVVRTKKLQLRVQRSRDAASPRSTAVVQITSRQLQVQTKKVISNTFDFKQYSNNNV